MSNSTLIPNPPSPSSSSKSNKTFSLELMHIIESLKTTKRAGWVRLGVKDPESISDHMYRMAILAMFCESDQELDIPKCVMLALVHDLAEAEVGDITPHDGISREEKHKLESLAIEKFTTKLLPIQSNSSQRLKSLWQEYEDGQTPEAKFVKDLDRFELALQAVEYETRHKLNSVQSFFDTTIPFIKHPEVKAWANELMDERSSVQGPNPFVVDYKDVRPEP